MSAAVDLVRLRRLAALPGAAGQTLAEELVAAFVAAGADAMAALRASVASGDADTLRRRAHSLRGSSLMLGADAFAALLDAVERTAASGIATTEGTGGREVEAVAAAWPATAEALTAAVAQLRRESPAR